MMSAARQVIDTDRNGARLSPEQLADVGVKPGERAVVRIRPYSEEDWIAEGVGRLFQSDEEEDAFFDRCPNPGA